MKNRRILLICAIAVLISLVVSGAAGAVIFQVRGTAHSVVFRPQGVNYIYSNNPEPIKPEMVANQYYGQYSIEEFVYKETEYDCEFTHGNQSYSNVTIGLAVRNDTNVPGEVRIASKQIGYSESGLDVFSMLALNYQLGLQDNLEQIVEVPAKSTVILLSSDVPSGSYVTGKTRFLPKNTNLRARVFWIKTDMLSSLSQIFELPQAEAEPNPDNSPWARSTGFFKYDYRTAVVDANITKSFYLGGLDNNPIEYEKGTNVLGNPVLRGNYGITYDFTVKNAKGKKIKITPNLYGKSAQIVLWTREKGWYRTNLITTDSETKYWLLDVPPDGRFKYVLPSFNCGNILFEFGYF